MNDIYGLAIGLISAFLFFLITHIVHCMFFYRQAAFGDFVMKQIEFAKKRAINKAREFAAADKKEGTYRHKEFARNASVDNFGDRWGIHQFDEYDFKVK